MSGEIGDALPEDETQEPLKARSSLSHPWEGGVADNALARLIEYGELHPRSTMLLAQRTHLTT
jgi:hypothetical protein